MNLGFLERLFGKKQEDKTVTEINEETFDINTASDFLKKKYDEDFQSFKDRAKGSYEEIQAALKNLKDSLSNLEKASFNDSIDSLSLHMILSQRKSFINKMKIMINQLDKPLDLNFDSIINYQNSSSHSVNETNYNTVKEFSLFEGLFEKESKAAFENFKTVFNATKNFINLVTEERKLLDPVTDAQDVLDLLRNDLESIQKRKKEIEDCNNKLSNLATEIKSEEGRLIELESGDEMKRFKQLLKKKEELNSQVSEIRFTISQNFSKIDRPLRKFRHLVQRGTEEIDDEKALDKFLDSPVDAIIETKNFKLMNSVLEKVRHSISSGFIDIKDKDKILSEISWFIDHEIFEELATKHDSLLEEAKELEKDISEQDIHKSKDELENHIEQLRRETQTTTEEIERIKKQMEKLDVSIKDRKNNLEKLLSALINKKVTINSF